MSIKEIKGEFAPSAVGMGQARGAFTTGMQQPPSPSSTGAEKGVGAINTRDSVNISKEAAAGEGQGGPNPVADAIRGYAAGTKDTQKTEAVGKTEASDKVKSMEASGAENGGAAKSKGGTADSIAGEVISTDKLFQDYIKSKKVKLGIVEKQHLKDLANKNYDKFKYNRKADEYLDMRGSVNKESQQA